MRRKLAFGLVPIGLVVALFFFFQVREMSDRAVAVFAGALVLAMVVLFIVIPWWEGRYKGITPFPTHYHSIRRLFDTLFVVAVATIGIELPLIRGLLREEMEEVINYPKQLSNPAFLRATFDRDALAAFRVATTRALSSPDTSLSNAEVELLEDYIYPSLKESVVTDVEYLRVFRIAATERGDRYFAVQESVNYVLHVDAVKQRERLPIYAAMERVEGVPDSLLFQFGTVWADGKPLEGLPEIERRDERGYVVFDGRAEHPVEQGQVTLSWSVRKCIPLSDEQWVTWISRPTKGLKITVQYEPAEMSAPKLYLFTVGGAPQTIRPETDLDAGVLIWRTDSWMLKNHGWVMLWHAFDREKGTVQAVE